MPLHNCLVSWVIFNYQGKIKKITEFLIMKIISIFFSYLKFFQIKISFYLLTIKNFFFIGHATWFQFSSDSFLLHFTHVTFQMTLVPHVRKSSNKNLLLMFFFVKAATFKVRFRHKAKVFAAICPSTLFRYPSDCLLLFQPREKTFRCRKFKLDRLHKQTLK